MPVSDSQRLLLPVPGQSSLIRPIVQPHLSPASLQRAGSTLSTSNLSECLLPLLLWFPADYSNELGVGPPRVLFFILASILEAKRPFPMHTAPNTVLVLNPEQLYLQQSRCYNDGRLCI